MATPFIAGIVAGLVGFASSFAVVVAGLQAVGASPAQSASGLLILSVTMGLGCMLLAWSTKQPITTAWSTPGAALLATASVPDGGFAAAVGAFVIAGLLVALTGFIPALGPLVRSIPGPIANAMLAGIVLALCLTPFQMLPQSPVVIGVVLVVWAALVKLAPRWAVLGALAAAVVAMVVTGAFDSVSWAGVAPELTVVRPQFSWQAVIALAIPLYLVTMTSQNIPGVSVMASFGYAVPWRAALGYTGLATAAGASFGGHAINLAAISAALAAGPEADRNPRRRWPAGIAAGMTYALLGFASGAVVTVAGAAPAGLFETIAAVGLFSSLAASLHAALADSRWRIPAAVTIVVAVSGLTIGGIGAAFWALVAGCGLGALLRWRRVD